MITRVYVAAFFELQLKRLPQTLPNGPSKKYPEVTFNNA